MINSQIKVYFYYFTESNIPIFENTKEKKEKRKKKWGEQKERGNVMHLLYIFQT